MTEKRPVFVIHGISNRDRSIIDGRVRALSRAALDRWEMHAPFWGDLGASTLGVELAMPEPRRKREVRSGAVVAVDRTGFGLPTVTSLNHQERLDTVLRHVSVALEGPPAQTRGVLSAQDTAEVLAALAEAWLDTHWLQHTDDRTLLAEVAAALVAAVRESLDEAQDGHVVRQVGRLRRLVGTRLPQLDRVAGAAIGATGERFYTWIRTTHAEYVALTLGDVLVYQRHGERIRKRIRDEIASVRGAGQDPDHAVHLVGHSLGAVIALDLATATDPVYTAGLVTFGCQWPLFHVVDPRGGQLQPYMGEPITLGSSIGRWTNLWHPLDPLGFVAGRLFRLPDGTAPTDVRVEHMFSEQLYTHSTYWTNPELVSALATTFDERHFRISTTNGGSP